MTTRRYPRSLAEAFPRDYADPIERPDMHPNDKFVTRGCILAVIALLALFLVGGTE